MLRIAFWAVPPSRAQDGVRGGALLARVAQGPPPEYKTRTRVRRSPTVTVPSTPHCFPNTIESPVATPFVLSFCWCLRCAATWFRIAFFKMVMANGFVGAPATVAGGPSRPPTPMPETNRGPDMEGGVRQGAGAGTLDYQLPYTPTGVPDPHGVPLPPLQTLGAPPVGQAVLPVRPPQLMGSLPFSPPVDTSPFAAVLEPPLLIPDEERAHLSSAMPVPSSWTGSPARSEAVVATGARTQLGAAALAAPAMASAGENPLRTLLNGIATAPEGGPPAVPRRAPTRAFVQAAPAPMLGGPAAFERAPVIGVAPPPLPPPPMPLGSPPSTRRRVSAPRPVRPRGGDAGTVPSPNVTTGAAPVRVATSPLPTGGPSSRSSPAGSVPGAASPSSLGTASASRGTVPAVRARTNAPRAAGAPPVAGRALSGRANAAGGSKKGKGRQGASSSQPPAVVTPNGQPSPAVASFLHVNTQLDGNAAASAAGDVPANAESAAMQLMRADINSALLSAAEMKDSVAGFRQLLETQGKVLEQLAKTMHALKAETVTGIQDIKCHVAPSKANIEESKANLKTAQDNQATLMRIRARLRAYDKQETAETELTHRVYLSADSFLDLMYVAIEDELMLGPEEAREYAMSRKLYPARKSKATPMRVRSILMRSRSHTVQAYKEALIPTFFEEIGVFKSASRTKGSKRKRVPSASQQSVLDVMDKPTAEGWLKDCAYMTSEQGFRAIIETLKQFMVLVGAESRVVASPNVGGNEYVNCTVGHFSIVCAIVRGELEKAAGIKPQRRNGLSGGIFSEFSAEVARADDFLPMHDVPANGLRLVDGGDEARGKLDAEESLELLEEESIDMSAAEAGVIDAIDDAEG